MTHAFKSFVSITIIALATMLQGCISFDKNTIVDQNVDITNQNWAYVNQVKTDFVINDASALYNLYLNLRVTAGYKYSNLFVLIHQTGPDKVPVTIRQEFTLANPDGEWLGQGSGNLYTYQVPFKTNFKFSQKGTYHISIEQNMRDNPLREVSDVGLRVEKAQ